MHLVIPLLNLLGLEIAYLLYPPFLYVAGFLVIALAIFFIWKRMRHDAHLLPVLFSAALLIITNYVLLVFLENAFIVHGFIAFTSLILFALLYSVSFRYRDSEGAPNYALENIIGYCNLAVFYFLSVDVFYLDLQTNQQFLLFLALFIIGAALLSYSALNIFNLRSWQTLVYGSVIILTLGEIFWAAKLLPVSVYSQGAIVTLLYYVTLGISRHYLLFGWEEVTRKVVSRYLTISVLGFLLVLGTSRWS